MRKYIIFDDVLKDKNLQALLDTCSSLILEGNIRVGKTRAEKGYPQYPCFIIEGKEILVGAQLEYYLHKMGGDEFDFEKAKIFTLKMIDLAGWDWDVRPVLDRWITKVIEKEFFMKVKDQSGYDTLVLKPGEPSWSIDQGYLEFSCFIAVCNTRYGGSLGLYRATKIFDMITALGSKLPQQLKKTGSGDLPKDLQNFKSDVVTCSANDVFATIRISVKQECEQAYKQALTFLCKLLQYGFPGSYTLKFTSSDKQYLPIKGLAKKGVNQLFTNAVKYKSLHALVKDYALLAMKEDQWYEDLHDEKCALPGSFAVFALAMESPEYHDLICKYLTTCDGEHQSIQGDFCLAYIQKYGLNDKTKEIYKLCENNIQHLPKKLTALYNKAVK